MLTVLSVMQCHIRCSLVFWGVLAAGSWSGACTSGRIADTVTEQSGKDAAVGRFDDAAVDRQPKGEGETPASDSGASGGGTVASDSGTVASDSGMVASDSGSVASDSGTVASDSGSPVDVGSVPAPVNARTPWPMGTSYIMSGHSLTDIVIASPWPGRIVEAVGLESPSAFQDIGKATIPGSTIEWRWENPEQGDSQVVQWPQDIRRFDGLVITTRVPLEADDVGRQEDQVDWLRRAAEDAWENGRGGRGASTLLYTTWTHLVPEPEQPHPEDGLSFRARLDRDEARWEGMQDYVNQYRPQGQEPVYLIPGHRLMMRIHDDIEAGRAPFSDIGDIFLDNIHPNDIGAYALTLLHYACIYGRDPGAYLPNRIVNEDTLSTAQAEYFKRIVPEVVTTYPRTGLTRLERP